MDDSFLEDLDLIPSKPKETVVHPVDRHVTTRVVTSSPLQQLSGRKSDPKQGNLELGKESRRTPEGRKQPVKARIPEKKDKPMETRLKPVENRVRIEVKELSPKDDIRLRTQESRLKVAEGKVLLGKDRARRSGSYKENSLSSDVSIKENSRPSDSSKDSTIAGDSKDKTKKHDSSSRRSDVRDKDPVALLTAIKDLISTYTKQESTKILKAMQELHVNSQATLIKNLVCQTDDLLKEIIPSKSAQRIQVLQQEKERLESDVLFMKRCNEELLARLEVLKQENLALKVKCSNLQNQGI